MPKISVIVPIYNVEKYIERCARSLFEQTFDDIEYIFVDDCTPDNSISILKEVIKEYPERARFTKIERMPRNSGLPTVRKHGVSIATGDYIIACDSDDYVEKEMYEVMYNMAKRHDLDLVQCDIDIVDDNRILNTLSYKKSQLESDELRKLIIDGDIANGLFNKLVRCSIYKNPKLKFPTRNIDEDNVVAVQLAYYSNKLGYIQKSFYKAYSNPASMTRRRGIEEIISRFEDSYANSQLILKFLLSHGYSANSKAVVKAKIRPKIFLWRAANSIESINKWKSIYSEINWSVIFDRRFPIGTSVIFLLVMTYIYPILSGLIQKLR